jgi:ribosomal-protein-alanine N-acetyltransferase
MIRYTPFPNIDTENLLLRRMHRKDIYDLFEMRKDPRMNEYVDAKLDEGTAETKNYIDKMNNGIDDNKWIIWAIEHRESKKVIGSISIWNINKELKSAELGYGINPDYQGKGFMKEALLSAVEYGFDVMKLDVVEAYTEESNLKSIKLLEGCNFTQSDRVDEQGYFSNRIYHMIVYRLENYKQHKI